MILLVLLVAAVVVFLIGMGVGAALITTEPLPYEQACDCWERMSK